VPRLAPLDFEDITSRRNAPSLETTQPGHRARMQRIRWFAYGIVVGTVGAAMGGGGAEALCRAVREMHAGTARAADSRSVEASPTLPPLDLEVAPGADPPPVVPTVKVGDLPPAAKDRGANPRGSTRAP
jgi:hypothetical protein